MKTQKEYSIKDYLRTWMSVVISLAMIFTAMPVFAFGEPALATNQPATVAAPVQLATTFPDMRDSSHWAYAALNFAVENGLLKGDNGKLYPERNITRAEIAAIVNRMFGSTEESDISTFKDMDKTKWYYSEMAKAYCMKLFTGVSATEMNPNGLITRQEAFTVLGRSIKLSSDNYDALNKFGDSQNVSSFAKANLSAMVEAGYVNGSNGLLNPKAYLTRESAAQIFYNIFKNIIKDKNVVTGDIKGNVLVNMPGVTVKDAKISGDMVIADGVGDGECTLDNVKLEGRLIIRGGGANSIKIINGSNIGSVIVSKSASGAVRVYCAEGAVVDVLRIDDGSDEIKVEGSFKAVDVQTNREVSFANADIGVLTINAEGANINIESGTITEVNIVETAKDTSLTTAKGSTIGVLVINTDVKVEVAGTVQKTEAKENVKINGEEAKPITKPEDKPSVGGGGSTGGGEEPSPIATRVENSENVNQFLNALNDKKVKEIVVTKSTDIDGQNLTISKDITIAEGVTLTINNGATLFDSKAILHVSGEFDAKNSFVRFDDKAKLINDGSVSFEGTLVIYNSSEESVSNGYYYADRNTVIETGAKFRNESRFVAWNNVSVKGTFDNNSDTDYTYFELFDNACVYGVPKDRMILVAENIIKYSPNKETIKIADTITVDKNIKKSEIRASSDSLVIVAYNQNGVSKMLDERLDLSLATVFVRGNGSNTNISLEESVTIGALNVAPGVKLSVKNAVAEVNYTTVYGSLDLVGTAEYLGTSVNLYGSSSISSTSKLDINDLTIYGSGSMKNNGSLSTGYIQLYGKLQNDGKLNDQNVYGTAHVYGELTGNGTTSNGHLYVEAYDNAHVSWPKNTQIYYYHYGEDVYGGGQQTYYGIEANPVFGPGVIVEYETGTYSASIISDAGYIDFINSPSKTKYDSLSFGNCEADLSFDVDLMKLHVASSAHLNILSGAVVSAGSVRLSDTSKLQVNAGAELDADSLYVGRMSEFVGNGTVNTNGSAITPSVEIYGTINGNGTYVGKAGSIAIYDNAVVNWPTGFEVNSYNARYGNYYGDSRTLTGYENTQIFGEGVIHKDFEMYSTANVYSSAGFNEFIQALKSGNKYSNIFFNDCDGALDQSINADSVSFSNSKVAIGNSTSVMAELLTLSSKSIITNAGIVSFSYSNLIGGSEFYNQGTMKNNSYMNIETSKLINTGTYSENELSSIDVGYDSTVIGVLDKAHRITSDHRTVAKYYTEGHSILDAHDTIVVDGDKKITEYATYVVNASPLHLTRLNYIYGQGGLDELASTAGIQRLEGQTYLYQAENVPLATTINLSDSLNIADLYISTGLNLKLLSGSTLKVGEMEIFKDASLVNEGTLDTRDSGFYSAIRVHGRLDGNGTYLGNDNSIYAEANSIINWPFNVTVRFRRYVRDIFYGDARTSVYSSDCPVFGPNVKHSDIEYYAEIYTQSGYLEYLQQIKNGKHYDSIWFLNCNTTIIDELTATNIYVSNGSNITFASGAKIQADGFYVENNSKATFASNAQLFTRQVYIDVNSELVNNGTIDMSGNTKSSEFDIYGFCSGNGELIKDSGLRVYAYDDAFVDWPTNVTINYSQYADDYLYGNSKSEIHKQSKAHFGAGVKVNYDSSITANVYGARGYAEFESLVQKGNSYNVVNLYGCNITINKNLSVSSTIYVSNNSHVKVAENVKMTVDQLRIYANSAFELSPNSELKTNHVYIEGEAEFTNNGTLDFTGSTYWSPLEIYGTCSGSGILKNDDEKNRYIYVYDNAVVNWPVGIAIRYSHSIDDYFYGNSKTSIGERVNPVFGTGVIVDSMNNYSSAHVHGNDGYAEYLDYVHNGNTYDSIYLYDCVADLESSDDLDYLYIASNSKLTLCGGNIINAESVDVCGTLQVDDGASIVSDRIVVEDNAVLRNDGILDFVNSTQNPVLDIYGMTTGSGILTKATKQTVYAFNNAHVYWPIGTEVRYQYDGYDRFYGNNQTSITSNSTPVFGEGVIHTEINKTLSAYIYNATGFAEYLAEVQKGKEYYDVYFSNCDVQIDDDLSVQGMIRVQNNSKVAFLSGAEINAEQLYIHSNSNVVFNANSKLMAEYIYIDNTSTLENNGTIDVTNSTWGQVLYIYGTTKGNGTLLKDANSYIYAYNNAQVYWPTGIEVRYSGSASDYYYGDSRSRREEPKVPYFGPYVLHTDTNQNRYAYVYGNEGFEEFMEATRSSNPYGWVYVYDCDLILDNIVHTGNIRFDNCKVEISNSGKIDVDELELRNGTIITNAGIIIAKDYIRLDDGSYQSRDKNNDVVTYVEGKPTQLINYGRIDASSVDNSSYALYLYGPKAQIIQDSGQFACYGGAYCDDGSTVVINTHLGNAGDDYMYLTGLCPVWDYMINGTLYKGGIINTSGDNETFDISKQGVDVYNIADFMSLLNSNYKDYINYNATLSIKESETLTINRSSGTYISNIDIEEGGSLIVDSYVSANTIDNAGTILINENKQLGASKIYNSGVINNEGDIYANSMSDTIDCSIENTGTIVNNGSISVYCDYSKLSAFENTCSGTGTISYSVSTKTKADLIAALKDTKGFDITHYGDIIVETEDNFLVVSKNVRFSSGTLTVASDTDLKVTAQLSVDTLCVDGSFESTYQYTNNIINLYVNGTCLLSEGAIKGLSNTFINGTLTLNNGRLVGENLVNSGIIHANNNSIIDFNKFNNNGTFELNSSAINVNNLSSGAITIPSDSSMRLGQSSRNTELQSPTCNCDIVNFGTLGLYNGTNVTTHITNNGQLNVYGNVFVQPGGFISNEKNMYVYGLLKVNAGDIGEEGKFTNAINGYVDGDGEGTIQINPGAVYHNYGTIKNVSVVDGNTYQIRKIKASITSIDERSVHLATATDLASATDLTPEDLSGHALKITSDVRKTIISGGIAANKVYIFEIKNGDIISCTLIE